MSRHLSFYNNDTLLQDNTEPGYFTEFTVPADTNLIVCYDDDYKITCNIRVTASSNQDIINYQFSTDSAVFLLKSLQNYTQNQTVRAQITVSNIAKDSNNLAQDIQNYLQSCGVSSGSSIDFSTIVTALNSITSALSALTNLSNLSNLTQLANIITAIQDKDNQSVLVSKLDNIFYYTVNGKKRSIISGHPTTYNLPSDWDTMNCSFFGLLHKLICVFSSLNDSQMYASPAVYTNNNKYFGIISSLLSAGGNPNAQNSYSNIQNLSLLKTVSDNLQNIETKLEQNLPFTTIVENDIVETNVAQNCSYGSKIEQIPFTE